MIPPRFYAFARKCLIKAASLIITGLLLGLAYEWAVPRIYKPDAKPGFWLGTAHGALMPAALPALLMNRDVPIFPEGKMSRIYKLGYIAGINACGLVFFGMAFWQPPSRRKEPLENSSKSAQ